MGLMFGCGGKGTETATGGEKAEDLATFLSGKRISFTVLNPDAPAQFQKQTMLIQFELDGTLTVGAVMNGKAVAIPDAKKSPFKVEGLMMIAKDPFEEGDASITFSSANPKVGDKVILQVPGSPKGEEVPIAAIEKAGKLEPMPQQFGFGQPEPGGPEPEIVGGSGAHNTTTNGKRAVGFGSKGEVAKSKHPAFLAHTWRIDPTTEGPKHGAIFAKDGSLSLITADGQMQKGGKWEGAGKILTLTYPEAKPGKEQFLKYQFLFGRGEYEYSDGGVEPFESLQLSPVGDGPIIEYIRSTP